MTTKMQFWNRSTFLVITGASRGIGKNMAIKFSALVTSDSTLVLVARDLQNLEATKTQILATNPKLDVKIYSIDLGKPNSQEFHSLLKSSAAEKQYELYFLVHNAAYSIDNVPASETDNIQQWNEYMSMNLYSVTALTSTFLKLFTKNERCLVNMSSGAAIRPFKGLAHYCVAKASRNMYFGVLAEENPDLNILNYSPGPIDTDLLRQSAKYCWNEEGRKFLQELVESPVKMEDTIQTLIQVLESRSYSNGEHVAFRDIQNSKMNDK